MKKLQLIALFLFMGANTLFGQSYYRNWTIQKDTKKDKIVLIIANNHYENNGRLKHPIPSAKALSKALKSKGADVLEGHDLNKKQFAEAISDFAKKLKNYQSGMIFYLGHGFQIDGENYLIPVDANPQSKYDVELEAINVRYLMKKIYDPTKPKVIVLDACRDNPFESSWTTKERASSKEGLAPMDASTNVEILFTTQKNSQVKDDNPYVNYFMEELQKHNCLEDIVRQVSRRIYQYNNQQVPASYGQLFEKVCFGKSIIPPIPIPINPTIVSKKTLKKWNQKGHNYYKNKDYKEAALWYRKSANQGDATAQYNLGFMYRNGYGVEKNYEQAVSWYRKAANQGDADAQGNLGFMYRNGYGVEKNDEQGVSWYRKAANQGHASGQYNLGFMYEKGHGVEKNYEQAVSWYRKAANQGDASAQNNLGVMYENGYGVEKNYEQAKYWYNKACQKGQKIACDNLAKL